jgi:hypothetical protein
VFTPGRVTPASCESESEEDLEHADQQARLLDKSESANDEANSILISTSLGLIIHSLADGMSLGASSALPVDENPDASSLDLIVLCAHFPPLLFQIMWCRETD